MIRSCAVNNMCNCTFQLWVICQWVNLRELSICNIAFSFYLPIYLGPAFRQRDSLCYKLCKRAIPPLEGFPVLPGGEWLSLILGQSIGKPVVATKLNLILQTVCSFGPLSIWFLSFPQLILNFEKKKVIFTDP